MAPILVVFIPASLRAIRRCLVPRLHRISIRSGLQRWTGGRAGARFTTRFAPQVPGVAQQRDTADGSRRSQQARPASIPRTRAEEENAEDDREDVGDERGDP